MQEVELTTEFALMMFEGITNKRKKALDDIYRDKDENTLNRWRLSEDSTSPWRRLNTNLDCGLSLSFLVARTLFYSLFTYVYDYQFGLGSPLEKVNPKAIPDEIVARIEEAGEKLRKKTAPEEVLQSVTRRTTNLQERNNVFQIP